MCPTEDGGTAGVDASLDVSDPEHAPSLEVELSLEPELSLEEELSEVTNCKGSRCG